MRFLNSLYEYAKAHSLEREAFFEENEVEWFLAVADDGSVSMRRLDGPRKGRGVPMHLPVPLKRCSNVQPNLVDNGMYVLGMKFEEEKKRSDPDWHKRCHEAYVDLVERVARDTKDPSVILVARVLRGRLENLARDPAVVAAGVKNIDALCPAVRVDGEWRPIAVLPSIRDWWVAHYGELQRMEAGVGRCLVTGEERPLARIHPLVTGVSGGRGTGVTLVTYNDPSSESWGKSQGGNGPVSVEAAILCAKAISRITSRKSGKRRSVTLDDGLHLCFITRREDEEAAADFVLSLLDPAEDDFHADPDGRFRERELAVWRSHRALFGAPRVGAPPPPPATPVDVLLIRLRPSSSRIEVVRNEERTFLDVERHLEQHFRDLSIMDPWTRGVRGDFPLRNVWAKEKGKPPINRGLLDALINRKNGKNGASPDVAAGMYLAAVFGQAYPPQIVPLALAAAVRSARDGRGVPLECAALLKAWLNREIRRNGKIGTFEGAQEMLDTNCNHPPYVNGRLFAVAERIQEMAIPGVVASVTKRFFDACSKQPGRIMPAIMRDLNHHMAKIFRAKPGLSIWCQKLVSSVVDNLPAEPEKSFPAALGLQDQMAFILGYFQQRTELFTKKEKPQDLGETA